MAENTLTEQQRKWMASVRASLETNTGKTLAQWVEIARICPETAPKARQRWLKENHGLGQNYAMMVLGEIAREAGDNPRDPKALREGLWTDPAGKAVLTALEAAMADFPDLVTGQRKTYNTWSRSYAFASARPLRGGSVRLGLAVEPDADPRLEAANKEGWSERLKASMTLAQPADVDAALKALLRSAWERS
jgi:hypothetical protein